MDGPAVAVVGSRDYQRRVQAEQAASTVLTLMPRAGLTEPVPVTRRR
jgi:hypothetical protein